MALAGVDFSTAAWNGLDLRPATAFQDWGLLSQPNGSQQDGETKEVDLASLSAQLFSYQEPVDNSKCTQLMQARQNERPATANLWAKSNCQRIAYSRKDTTQEGNTEVIAFPSHRGNV